MQVSKIKMFVLLLSWTILSPAKASDYYSTLTGTISHIRDGDTIEVGNIPIRIAALNCPENDTPEGQFASAFALQFKGSKVICQRGKTFFFFIRNLRAFCIYFLQVIPSNLKD